MKKMTLVLLAFVLSFGVGIGLAADTKKDTPTKKSGKGPGDYKQKLGYAIGMDIGGNLRKQEINPDLDWLFKGIEDALKQLPPQLSEKEYMETMTVFREEMQKKMIKKMADRTNIGKQNKVDGQKFLEANKKKPGVQTLPSGLQYKVIKEGTGPMPTPSDQVTVHYKGTLLNGKEFDSSYRRNEPATFPVTGVIPGWTEALLLMKTGSVWEVYIPSDLAYGERGAGQDIAPDSTLIFTIEFIGIKSDSKATGVPKKK